MEQHDSLNIWFTLSMPDWFWKDLQSALGDSPQQGFDEDDSCYEERCRKRFMRLFIDSPHMANEHVIRSLRCLLTCYLEVAAWMPRGFDLDTSGKGEAMFTLMGWQGLTR